MINHLYLSVFILLFYGFSLSLGLPTDQQSTIDNQKTPDSKKHSTLFSLPFLELTNDGIKVNFGGYHAEAGLGGILGGSGKGGGLYANAGTPFGAHAFSGLGGTLSGKNSGSTGGGLYAGAGLGQGTEVVAGTDGILSGSDPSQSGGRVYAGSSHAGRTKIVSKTLSNDQTSNIQPISKTTKIEIIPEKPEGQMVRREADSFDDKINSADVGHEPGLNLATETPGVYAYPTRRCRRKRLCNNYVRKTVVINQNSLPPLQLNDITQQNIIPTLNEVSNEPIPANSDDKKYHTQVDHSTPKDTGYKPAAIAPGPPIISSYPPVRSRTIFDDIFNIPISTLAAVNQLLNSKIG